MRTSERLTNRLKAVQDDAIEAIKDYFRGKQCGTYQFDDPIQSTPNGEVSIQAIKITSMPIGARFEFVAEGAIGNELEPVELSDCAVQDIVWALGELECDKYSFQPLEEVANG